MYGFPFVYRGLPLLYGKPPLLYVGTFFAGCKDFLCCMLGLPLQDVGAPLPYGWEFFCCM